MWRALLVGFLVLLTASIAEALDITACDQTVPAGEVGVLVADVTCTTEYTGVGLERGATLDLNGFTLSGGTNVGVACRDRTCTVHGPGTIDGTWTAIYMLEQHTTLTVTDVTIRNAEVAILGSARQHDRSRLVATNVAIENASEWALSATVIRAENLTVTGTAPTLYAVIADRLFGNDIDVSNNGAIGIKARKVKASSLTAMANAGAGMDVARAVLTDSVLTGNAPLGDLVDIRSAMRPRLVNSACDLSSDGNGGTWGVCTND